MSPRAGCLAVRDPSSARPKPTAQRTGDEGSAQVISRLPLFPLSPKLSVLCALCGKYSFTFCPIPQAILVAPRRAVHSVVITLSPVFPTPMFPFLPCELPVRSRLSVELNVPFSPLPHSPAPACSDQPRRHSTPFPSISTNASLTPWFRRKSSTAARQLGMAPKSSMMQHPPCESLG